MVAVAILAAGRGTRMKSHLPKVLHSLGSKSLVERVLESLSVISPTRCFVIVGYGSAQVRSQLQSYPNVEFVEQTKQLGTGHAVQQLLPHLEGYTGDLLVLNGDVPLLRSETLETLTATHRDRQNAATILTAQIPNPQGYGRVFCSAQNVFGEIVEDRDCTDAQKQNRRINAGIYCFNWPKLSQILPQLQANNDQEEYYLTDAVNYLDPVTVVDAPDPEEIFGVNSRQQLAQAYQILQARVKDEMMSAGVTLIDPDSVTIDDTVRMEPDTIVEPQTHLRGKTTIASGCRIGPGCSIENSQIAQNVTVLYSVISDSVVQAGSRIGPFAHLRGAAEIGQNCRVGNFVEIKKSQIGDRTNVDHLSYLGDATLGDRVNVGAGTITANYDGVNKHPTHIGSGSKTGANSVFVAPVTVGENVTVAAGSTISKDVPDNSLAIARSRQTSIPDWPAKNSG
ncbi:bifunctional UDP-N-acetylglucosamine diphosphorylase/glucosamine-1-phosphate N-acetyltransferase GlmU [Oscillatoriales cyanobacterium LEGE 11467]|uniref:Bifunctional protein GlmU n=1 Tax=Zarconia navalis LEGE 11467 TaxID=1828826 RepID=A0A928Z8V4_9CYAN|nr:bifunctional UDP-N-acetylglucosamine diphosphorylase/glucosamine-1-phosphate N-acetyltransferase GlmU [Zarconia navalis]MBE9041935.1 bifunctional UDP-N-acetylglucosamine diphosphorylase/glucosamine-1-phosphate N-acetyltransferase GlmU [Zarconia navalis LEGE 11467]